MRPRGTKGAEGEEEEADAAPAAGGGEETGEDEGVLLFLPCRPPAAADDAAVPAEASASAAGVAAAARRSRTLAPAANLPDTPTTPAANKEFFFRIESEARWSAHARGAGKRSAEQATDRASAGELKAET